MAHDGPLVHMLVPMCALMPMCTLVLFPCQCVHWYFRMPMYTLARKSIPMYTLARIQSVPMCNPIPMCTTTNHPPPHLFCCFSTLTSSSIFFLRCCFRHHSEAIYDSIIQHQHQHNINITFS